MARHDDKDRAFQDLITSMIVPLTRFSNRKDLSFDEKAVLQRLSDHVVTDLDKLELLIDA